MKLEVKGVMENVVSHLRNEIITGGFKPGDKLNENLIAETLGISRPPLREAFRIIEKENLITCVPRKGTFVNGLSIEDLKQIFQAREMIECYTIDLLKDRNIKDLPGVEAAFQAALDLPVPFNNDPEGWLSYRKVLFDFHFKMIEACGNYRILKFYEALCSNLIRYQILYFRTIASGSPSIDAHRQILEFMKMGSFEGAKEVIRKHIRFMSEILEQKILSSKIAVQND